ncbi:hypothetical protein UlMin_002812 [Ulmus minor]
MAGHRDSNASEKKSSEAINDLPTFNAENFRTFMSIIGGVIAGILGFNALMGFVLYFIVMVITSIGEEWSSTIFCLLWLYGYLIQVVFSLLKIIHFFSLFSISFTTLFYIPRI